MMGTITIDDMRGYKKTLGNEMDTEESMVTRLKKWNNNTPIQVIQNKEYIHFKGQILDVMFNSLEYLGRHYKGNPEEHPITGDLSGYIWGFPSKSGEEYYTGKFKEGLTSVLTLRDIPLQDYIDFMAYYLVDATEYILNNGVTRDDHTYHAESRFLKVGVFHNRRFSSYYYRNNQVTKYEVAKRLVAKYGEQVNKYYGEEVSKKGEERLMKSLNEGDLWG